MSDAKAALNQVVQVTWEDKDPPRALLTRRRTSKYQILYDAVDDMEFNKWRRFEISGDALRLAYNSLTSYVGRQMRMRYTVRTDKSKLPEKGIIYLCLLGPKAKENSNDLLA